MTLTESLMRLRRDVKVWLDSTSEPRRCNIIRSLDYQLAEMTQRAECLIQAYRDLPEDPALLKD